MFKSYFGLTAFIFIQFRSFKSFNYQMFYINLLTLHQKLF